MPPKKPANQQSVKALIERINVLGENFRSRPQTGAFKRSAATTPSDPPSPPKMVKFVEPPIPDPPRIASDDLADNPYAQEIFMYKTNVHDVATRIVAARDAEGMQKRIRAFKKKLYRMFATEPKNRIRYPLHMVQFESSYYEYRFFLALHKPLHSDEEYQDYKEQLATAGIDECWVTMRKHNRLLMYEDRIVQKLKSNFKEWSLKLDKLDSYLMDMHARQPAPKVRKPIVATTKTAENRTLEGDDNLLEALAKHSDAKQRFTSRQIRRLFPHILRNSQLSKDFQWLVFDSDELNKRFKLGSHAPQAPNAPQEAEEVVNVAQVEVQAESVASHSSSSGVASPDSQIAQMRSEMAMTQPPELIQLENSRFADTQALVNALEQPEIQPQIDEVVESTADEVGHVLSPMITPAQVEVIEISDSPMHDDDEVQIKEEFLYTLDYFRKFTNIEEHIINGIKQKYPNSYEKQLSKLDRYVEQYYKSVMPLLLNNKLPPALRHLSRKERKDSQAAMTGQQLNTSGASSTISELPVAIQTEISPITETPSVPRVPRKARLIAYEEDEDDLPAQPGHSLPMPDTLPMPNSEDFLPPVCSTQLPYEPLASPPRRRDTPFHSPSISMVTNRSPKATSRLVSPVALPPIVVPTEVLPVPNLQNICTPNRQATPLQPPTSSSRIATPAAFDSSSSSNATVIVNTKSPQEAVSIKRELNTTSYEDEVEFVEVPNRSILIEDSIDNINDILLERQSSNSCLAAFPSNLRGMVSTLFRETRDTTLSQGSGASSGSGEAPADTQADSSVRAMGFHQHFASTQDK